MVLQRKVSFLYHAQGVKPDWFTLMQAEGLTAPDCRWSQAGVACPSSAQQGRALETAAVLDLPGRPSSRGPGLCFRRSALWGCKNFSLVVKNFIFKLENGRWLIFMASIFCEFNIQKFPSISLVFQVISPLPRKDCFQESSWFRNRTKFPLVTCKKANTVLTSGLL